MNKLNLTERAPGDVLIFEISNGHVTWRLQFSERLDRIKRFFPDLEKNPTLLLSDLKRVFNFYSVRGINDKVFSMRVLEFKKFDELNFRQDENTSPDMGTVKQRPVSNFDLANIFSPISELKISYMERVK
jgi:hypothetical protein